MLVRDIIDIDSTYEDFEASDDEEVKTKKENSKKAKSKDEKNNENDKSLDEKREVIEEDEFNLSLAKMEEEIKPKILKLLESLNKNYFKLQKISKRKFGVYFIWQRNYPVSKNKNFKKIQSILVENFKNLQIAPNVVEELVQSH